MFLILDATSKRTASMSSFLPIVIVTLPLPFEERELTDRHSLMVESMPSIFEVTSASTVLADASG